MSDGISRRGFLRTLGIGAAACALDAARALGAGTMHDSDEGKTERTNPLHAPACGLYCPACMDFQTGQCHGCGCDCGCAGQSHQACCALARCAAARKLESCADCADLPCTKLIQFTNDPVWRTHSVCIENLRRRKAIGVERWLDEQREYFSDEKARGRWRRLYEQCSDANRRKD